jgi:hypothetical protein
VSRDARELIRRAGSLAVTSACLATALFVGGCGSQTESKPGTNPPAAGANPLNAPADYLGAITKGQQNTVKTVDTVSLNKAIEMFNLDQGRNPKDLNELVQQKYIPRIPDAPYGTKLEYDAVAGKVRVVKP